MAETEVDINVRRKLESYGLKDNDYNFQYTIMPKGTSEFKPVSGKEYLSKAFKPNRSNPEFLIFGAGNKNKKIEHIVIIEDKNLENEIGDFDSISKEAPRYQTALVDGFHYGYELLSKTKGIKSVFVIGVGGVDLASQAFLMYKKGSFQDKYCKLPSKSFDDDEIQLRDWGTFVDWEVLETPEILMNFIDENVLSLGSPDTKENIAYLQRIAAKLSKEIDGKIKLDPYKRLLLVSGLLIGTKQRPTLIDDFDDISGPETLYTNIKNGLPSEKFSSDKKKQLLSSFSFIKNDPVLQKVIKDKKGNELGYPLSFVSKILLKKAPSGFSVMDLMSNSSHIDLLGLLFDVFTKYMNVGGTAGDIVLTPSHLTKLMAELIDVNKNDFVIDITAGTGGFLISSLQIMEHEVQSNRNASIIEHAKEINQIKEQQLWGVEYDTNMYATAVTNMLLHGDGKSHIYRGDSLADIELTTGKPLFSKLIAQLKEVGKKRGEHVEFSKLLINPPYNNQEYFVRNGLRLLKTDGLGAVICPKTTFSTGDSAVIKNIFAENQLQLVIDLPDGQFKTKNKVIGTQVAIFIFKHGRAQSFDEDMVTFIKVLKDEVGTKGNLKGIASSKTKQLFNEIVEFRHSNYLDSTLLRDTNYFAPILNVKIKKGKYVYKDYIPAKSIIPSNQDISNVVGTFLDYLLTMKDDQHEV